MNFLARPWPRTLAIGFSIAWCCALAPAIANALEAKPGEEERLDKCERQLCRLVLDKKPVDGNFSCRIDKHWGKRKIKKGADSKSIDWGFGDARCEVAITMDRQSMIHALTAPKFELKFWPQNVNCLVESSSGVEPVRVRLAPRLKFENGRVKKVRLKLKEVDGPAMLSGLIWSTAKLEQSLGIFHADMLEDINEFLHKKCAKNYGPEAQKKK